MVDTPLRPREDASIETVNPVYNSPFHPIVHEMRHVAETRAVI
jgi:hypothetical protein